MSRCLRNCGTKFLKHRDIGNFMYLSAVVYSCCVLLSVVGCSCVLLCVVACYRGLLVAVCEQVLRGGLLGHSDIYYFPVLDPCHHLQGYNICTMSQ
jgi:hypothetical protein